MQQPHFIIERMEAPAGGGYLCFLEQQTYGGLTGIEAWEPLGRLLVDSDQKQLVYMFDIDGEWLSVRFPRRLWPKLDDVLCSQQELLLVVALANDGTPARTVSFSNFLQEGLELVANMRGNANYGEDMLPLVEACFPRTIDLVNS